MRELYNDYRILEKQERQAVKRIHFEVKLLTFFSLVSSTPEI